ncbi:hydroxyethylthiazole kinase [Vibrio porteresiae]|uniref:Hydroxyethylthiazole kinase n=1 Tax=Vibrio porteresiae DSM 19223 TaxID=1123496 RepID=A0ABZ0QFM0_9VIBR|nr:hydroxyethylthiazole kinase [Vibrio porteresiae]WPC75279.1 hydroxyethylthiazole kinase [Vibrio porteresiae DSM 19223]
MNIKQIADFLATVRRERPLVINMTNDVVMNLCANSLLALGASPIMAHSRQEMAELMPLAGALVVNIGTLDEKRVAQMEYAIECANQHHTPIVLDPVGCGASTYRTKVSRYFASLACHLTLRANASEVIALAGHTPLDNSAEGYPLAGHTPLDNSAEGYPLAGHTPSIDECPRGNKGVDSQDSTLSALGAAHQIREQYQTDVSISGATDIIVTQNHDYYLTNGSPIMPYVTGLGCALSSLTGAFAAVGECSGLAAAAIWGVVGEIAAEQCDGPGFLAGEMLDILYHLDEATLSKRLKMNIERHPY